MAPSVHHSTCLEVLSCYTSECALLQCADIVSVASYRLTGVPMRDFSVVCPGVKCKSTPDSRGKNHVVSPPAKKCEGLP